MCDQLNFADSVGKILVFENRSANKDILYRFRSLKIFPYFVINLAANAVKIFFPYTARLLSSTKVADITYINHKESLTNCLCGTERT